MRCRTLAGFQLTFRRTSLPRAWRSPGPESYQPPLPRVGSRRSALSDWLGRVELPPATEIAFPSRLAARRTDASHWNQRKGRERVNLKCESDLRNTNSKSTDRTDYPVDPTSVPSWSLVPQIAVIPWSLASRSNSKFKYPTNSLRNRGSTLTKTIHPGSLPLWPRFTSSSSGTGSTKHAGWRQPSTSAR